MAFAPNPYDPSLVYWYDPANPSAPTLGGPNAISAGTPATEQSTPGGRSWAGAALLGIVLGTIGAALLIDRMAK